MFRKVKASHSKLDRLVRPEEFMRLKTGGELNKFQGRRLCTCTGQRDLQRQKPQKDALQPAILTLANNKNQINLNSNIQMKKSLYYEHVFRRTNAIKEFIYSFFLAIASWPRLLLEVFLRRNMGERYFSFSTAVILLLILCWLPFPITAFRGAMNLMSPSPAANQQINLNSYLQIYEWCAHSNGNANRPKRKQ